MSERLPAKVEASGLCRKAESLGGFAAILQRGDPDRGTILLLIAERGQFVALLERRLAADFTYQWTKTAENEEKSKEAVASRSQSDPDIWLIELDIADAKRFIADLAEFG